MQNTPPIQNQTQPAPKKEKPWLLISLVFLLLGATGTFSYKYYDLKQQPTLSSTPVSNEIFSEPESDESLITSS